MIALKESGKTILIITHQLDMAGAFVDYAIRIKRGKEKIISKDELSL